MHFGNYYNQSHSLTFIGLPGIIRLRSYQTCAFLNLWSSIPYITLSDPTRLVPFWTSEVQSRMLHYLTLPDLCPSEPLKFNPVCYISDPSYRPDLCLSEPLKFNPVYYVSDPTRLVHFWISEFQSVILHYLTLSDLCPSESLMFKPVYYISDFTRLVPFYVWSSLDYTSLTLPDLCPSKHLKFNRVYYISDPTRLVPF